MFFWSFDTTSEGCFYGFKFGVLDTEQNIFSRNGNFSKMDGDFFFKWESIFTFGYLHIWMPRVIWSLIPRLIEVLITSATDALAFLVGATTVLPALSWFCTYAGILSMFDAGAGGSG